MGFRETGGWPMNVAKRASRAALRAILPAEDLVLEDRRSQDLREIAVVQDPALIASITEIFAGTDLPNDREKIELIVSIRNEVRAEWQTARNSFLAIGRALLIAEERLTPEEFRRMRQSTERLFPFSDGVASQLRQVARAVDAGRLSEIDCPGAYSVAYQLTLLDEPSLELARDRNLIRPDVTRMEVMNFRREMKVTHSPEPNRVHLAELKREKTRLERQQVRLNHELDRISKRLTELSQLVK